MGWRVLSWCLSADNPYVLGEGIASLRSQELRTRPYSFIHIIHYVVRVKMIKDDGTWS